MLLSLWTCLQRVAWLRVAYALCAWYIFAAWMKQMLLLLLLLQVVARMSTASISFFVHDYVYSAAEYVFSLVRYLLFLSESPPFPFNYCPDDLSSVQHFWQRLRAMATRVRGSA